MCIGNVCILGSGGKGSDLGKQMTSLLLDICEHKSKVLSLSLKRKVVTENPFSISFLVRLPGISLNSYVCF